MSVLYIIYFDCHDFELFIKKDSIIHEISKIYFVIKQNILLNKQMKDDINVSNASTNDTYQYKLNLLYVTYHHNVWIWNQNSYR